MATVTTDITRMKRVVEVNTKKDDRQYELNLSSENKEEPMNALEYLTNEKDEEIESLRTFMLSVKIIEDAKITGRKLTQLPFPLLEYIESYEEAYGALSEKKEEG